MEHTQGNNAATPAGFTLAPPSGPLKKGFPTSGYWIIAGLPKSGKTWLAASRKDAVLLELEHGGADRIPWTSWKQDVPDMVTFRAAFEAALNEPKAGAIVIDTLDEVLKHIASDVAEVFGLENLSDRREGVNGFAVWRELDRRVDRMIETFKGCGKLVLLLAHFKEPRLDNEGKLVVTQSINAPSARTSGALCAHADLIAVASKRRFGETSRFELKVHGDGVVGAYGSRIPELEDKTIVLPRENQWQSVIDAFTTGPKGQTVAPTSEPPKQEQTNGLRGKKHAAAAGR